MNQRSLLLPGNDCVPCCDPCSRYYGTTFHAVTSGITACTCTVGFSQTVLTGVASINGSFELDFFPIDPNFILGGGSWATSAPFGTGSIQTYDNLCHAQGAPSTTQFSIGMTCLNGIFTISIGANPGGVCFTALANYNVVAHNSLNCSIIGSTGLCGGGTVTII